MWDVNVNTGDKNGIWEQNLMRSRSTKDTRERGLRHVRVVSDITQTETHHPCFYVYPGVNLSTSETRRETTSSTCVVHEQGLNLEV